MEPFKLPGSSLPKAKSFTITTGPTRVRLPPARKGATTVAPQVVNEAPREGSGLVKPPPRRVSHADHVPRDFFSSRYRLLRQEGHGQAVVFKARDCELEMDVALKFIPLQVLQHEEALTQLKHEAAIALRLTHENIVRLHTIDFKNARPFIIMEYVAGGTMREILTRKGSLSMASVMAVSEACVKALAYAHKRGVLHRDIKPENIMVTLEGVVKIVDFGTATIIKSVPGSYIEGTPGYMAPEQVDVANVDARADVFGLCAVLWELLACRAAFPNRDDLNHMYDKVPAGGKTLPDGIAAVLRKGMAREPGARWPTILEFGSALQHAASLSDADLEVGRHALLE